MHTALLNIGFKYIGNNTYTCEDITVELRDGHLYVMPLEMEVTLDELLSIVLEAD